MSLRDFLRTLHRAATAYGDVSPRSGPLTLAASVAIAFGRSSPNAPPTIHQTMDARSSSVVHSFQVTLHRVVYWSRMQPVQRRSDEGLSGYGLTSSQKSENEMRASADGASQAAA